MKRYEISRTTFTVADFLGWQRADLLELSPSFQRRSVWKPGAKSFLIDTIVRGLPMPVIFVRDQLNLRAAEHHREIVDGQQRLRTVLAYVAPETLSDFDETRDRFTISRAHNSDLAGRTFESLSDDLKTSILTYQFSVHVLPIGTEDREVLQIFQRMNSTGQKLNGQELRNAEYFGLMKTSMYELAATELDRWRHWKLFSEDAIARMKEVELVSDLANNMIGGLSGKSQQKLDLMYNNFEEEFDGSKILASRFKTTMDTISRTFDDEVAATIFRSEVNFFTLFCVVYELLFGLGSPLRNSKPKKLPPNLRNWLEEASTAMRDGSAPIHVMDAIQRASADLGRRQTRFEYLLSGCK